MPLISGGFILQPRIFDSSIASKMPPVAREVWLYILRNVNHADNGRYKRGEGFFRYNDIQNDLCWYVGYRKECYSKPQIAKAVRKLSESSMIATTKATRGVIITVLKYSIYQDPKNYKGNGEGSEKGARREGDGHTKNNNEQEITKNNTRFRADVFLSEYCENKQLISDWLKVRKMKKAANTRTALNSFIGEVKKSGLTCGEVLEMCCERSWASFQAEWTKEQKPQKPHLQAVDYRGLL